MNTPFSSCSRLTTMLAGVCLLLGMTMIQAAPSNAPASETTEFAQRNSPASLDKLGREFLSRTFLGEWDMREFSRPGRWTQLKEVRQHMDTADYAAALDLLKRYTFQKLRYLDDFGLPKARFDVYCSGVPGAQWMRPLITADDRDAVLKSAEDLMTGFLKVGDRRIEIGLPGAINWETALKDAPEGGLGWPYDVSAFNSLLGAYILTGQQNYLDKWAEYADDWAMNQHTGVGTTGIAAMPDHWSEGTEQAMTFLRYLGTIASQSNAVDRFPTGTFARVLMRFIDDYIPASIIFSRSDPGNWSDASLTALPVLGLFLDEYRIAPQLLHESRRRLELLTSTHNLPDGPDLDSTVGYGFNYLLGASTFLDVLQSRHIRVADWMLPAWEQQQWRSNLDLGVWMTVIREEMYKRARFLVAHTMANGEWPIGGSRSHRHNRANDTYDRLQYFVPEIFRNQDMARILEIGTGRSYGDVPSFTSERFPYAGFTYIRAGWNPMDPYLFMYCSPWAVGGELSGRNNNAIGLSAYGCDLLETGENGTYDEPRTPVRVDGEDQFFGLGIPLWGHRGGLRTASTLQQPPAWRWHDSTRFSVAEGIYAGNFGKSKHIGDVTHQRMVHYVREAGLWIVTDRLRSESQVHDYTLDWRFPIQPGDRTDFTAEQIEIDDKQQTIKTTRPGGANVSLYHFPSVPLAFAAGEERTPTSRDYRIHDFLRVSGTWKGQGESVVVTVIYPRAANATDLTDIKSMNGKDVVGFEATTPNGFRISYRVAVNELAGLMIGDRRISGESLLTVTTPGHEQSGIAMGCATRGNDGKIIPATLPDFEFAQVAGKTETIPIQSPVQPVQILPANTTVIVEPQIITLACATPTAQLYYTLDGSDPTPASLLYKGPFTITGDATIKARAFRQGVTTVPATMSCVAASIVTQASFVTRPLAKSVQISATTPGLHYDYYEGRWQELLTSLDRLKPIKSGQVQKLFDLSPKGTAPVFAFKYTGYLDVVSDGVYTFYAPAEFYEPNIMAGYELHLLIDGNEWYPGTGLHALGAWSAALQKGKHEFTVTYADMRADGVQMMNKPNELRHVWDGNAPDIQISGPGLPKGPISAQVFSYAK